MADMTAERRRTGEAVARLLRRAGFGGVGETELSGAYMIDFQVEATEPWESRNLPGGIHVTKDGGFGGVAIRHPSGNESRRSDMARAADAAVSAAGPHWEYYFNTPKMAPGRVSPHIHRSMKAPPASPRQLVDQIRSAVSAYQRAVDADSDFSF